MFHKRYPAVTLAALLTLGLTACPGSGGKKKMEEKQRALDDARAEAKAKKEEKEPIKEVISLERPWEDSSYVELRADGPCPPNFWALFNGETPGATKEEKKENAGKRAELAKAAREATYLVKLRGPDAVKLMTYDAPKGVFPLEVIGTIDCTDSIGRVAVAWTAVRAGDPGNSAAKEGADVTQNMWIAEPLKYTLPMKGMADAKEFDSKNRLGLSARVFFKLGKTELDRKLKKIPKVTEKAAGETLVIGGGTEDWGAGRMVRAEGVGIRIATDKEKTSLIEKKP
jgi:hypothetical protein